MIRRKANENIELSWDDHNPELELVTLPNGKKVRRRKDGKRVIPRGPRSEGTLDPAKARAAYSKIMRLGQIDHNKDNETIHALKQAFDILNGVGIELNISLSKNEISFSISPGVTEEIRSGANVARRMNTVAARKNRLNKTAQMDQMARRLSPAAMKFYTLLKDELDELGGMRPGAGAGVLFQRAVVEAIQQSGGGITCERLYNLYNKAQNVDHSIAGAEIDDEDYETEEEVNGRMGWD